MRMREFRRTTSDFRTTRTGCRTRPRPLMPASSCRPRALRRCRPIVVTSSLPIPDLHQRWRQSLPSWRVSHPHRGSWRPKPRTTDRLPIISRPWTLRGWPRLRITCTEPIQLVSTRPLSPTQVSSGANTSARSFRPKCRRRGIETALLLHYALAVEGVSVYVQAGFAESASSLANPRALIAMGTADFTIQLPYHAMRHYSLHTDPGWVRVAAGSTATGLLASAWLSPAEDALTVVLLNSGLAEVDVKLEAGQTRWTSSRVTRTAFAGVERSAELGAVPAQGVFRMPGHAMLTVAMRR